MKKFIKHILNKSMRFLKPAKGVQFFRFGYNPSGYLREDIVNCFFGTKNLYKHYQAKKIFQALDLKESHKVLDFGCGSGYISIEIAKLAQFTLGIDINPELKKIPIPDFLQEKLQFEIFDNHFEEKWQHCFDKILLSEVILSVPDKETLLKLCYNLLKPGGEIVLVNGLGKYFIEKVIFKNDRTIKLLKKIFPKLPSNYHCYEEMLCSQFGNSSRMLMSRNEIIEIFRMHKYSLTTEMYGPKKWIVNIIELKQFMQVMMKGKALGTNLFSFLILKALFSFINLFQRKEADSGYIAVFVKQ